MSAIIKTEALTKKYGKIIGVENLSLKVEKGDIFGYIGPNGSGKSTTIRVLLGLISQTSGYAEIFGLNCRKNKEEILSRIGYVPSEAIFYNKMKVRDLIKFSSRLRRKDCTKAASELCERLQLDTAKRVEDLSLGNRKKVSVVCALQHNPELLVLDEPTSGLDPLMQKVFWDILSERNKEGATVFLSSHVLSEVQHHCKNIGIIREGKLIVQDSVDSLSKTSARRVTIRGVKEYPDLNTGIIEKMEINNGISFLYQGDMNILLNKLSNLSLEDITITEPELEEIFLHFYEKDVKEAGE